MGSTAHPCSGAFHFLTPLLSMAKRFTDTEIWSEDWFLEMPNEYKMFWYYMLANCDHVGFFKVNLRPFRGLIEVNLTSTDALKFFNNRKNRIRVIRENYWYIEDFIVYQYGTTLNLKNRLHLSIVKKLKEEGVELTSIRGLVEVKDTLKDKDKDKDKEIKREEGGVGEEGGLPDPLEGMCYNIDEFLEKHQKQYEALVMNSPVKDQTIVKAVIKKYHLTMIEQGEYPKKPLQFIAGITKWLYNEKKFSGNGQHNATSVGKTIEFD